MTADAIDAAAQSAELDLADALEAQRLRAAMARRPAAVGHCLNPHCCEDFGEDRQRLYCGPACAEEHGRITRR